MPMRLKEIAKRTPAYRVVVWARQAMRAGRERAAFRHRAAFYRQFVQPGSLVFDVGANLGNRTDVFLALGARVLAIEPQAECVKRIQRRHGDNRNLTIVPKAVGAEAGELTLHLTSETTIASASRPFIDATHDSGRFAEYRYDRAVQVPVTTLDALIAVHGRPDFVKIDVEGFEPEVVRGLSQPVPCLSYEFTPELFAHAEAVLRHLASLGPVEANYSLTESMVFGSERWLTPNELLEALAPYRQDTLMFGDIYVRTAR